MLHSDWPPSPCILSVFSSRTGLREDRLFTREGEAAGTVADMRQDQRFEPYRHAEYCRGALYVHCQTDFVMRISSSTSTYRVIKPPIRGTEVSADLEFHLARSKMGIYYALLDDNYRLRVWILDESCDQIEWKLRHDSGRGLPFSSLETCDHGPWVLTDVDYDDESEGRRR
ncbi:hypothetical protein C2845_PM06G23320 [Panicum miliaceum]|uniref:F-box associated domain-containing protein n=1 Tax=Panicum miliaceum TaxID=4540 RepID=A0A3L6R602_PANMI|nr:hypothetical protein C2845_PM06G23320 [Panicum miliaceum]